MNFNLVTRLWILTFPCYVYSQMLYRCNFDDATPDDNCFRERIFVSEGLGIVSEEPVTTPASDVTSITLPTSSGERCRIPYKIRNYTWDMYFCFRGSCPTETSANNSCVIGKYALLQLRTDGGVSLSLKAGPNGINGKDLQHLSYFYYIPAGGAASITVLKKETDDTTEVIDYVASSPINSWMQRNVLFNATDVGYDLYFNLLKSSDVSIIDIGLDEISIWQDTFQEGLLSTDSDYVTTIATSADAIFSSSSETEQTEPEVWSVARNETFATRTTTLASTVHDSGEVLYQCTFDSDVFIDSCFVPALVITSAVGIANSTMPAAPLSDVTSSLKPTNNGQVCKLPYRIDSYDWDMYFCNEGRCPTDSRSNGSCQTGKFGHVQLLDNTKNVFQLKTTHGGIDGVDQQCLVYYYYMSTFNSSQTIVTVQKQETSGLNQTLDTVTTSPWNGWIRREVSFRAEGAGYRIYFEVQRLSGWQEPYVGFDEISIRQGICKSSSTATTTTTTTEGSPILSSTHQFTTTTMTTSAELPTAVSENGHTTTTDKGTKLSRNSILVIIVTSSVAAILLGIIGVSAYLQTRFFKKASVHPEQWASSGRRNAKPGETMRMNRLWST